MFFMDQFQLKTLIVSLLHCKTVVYSGMWSFAAYAREMMRYSSLLPEDKTSYVITDFSVLWSAAAEHIFLRFDVYNL